MPSALAEALDKLAASTAHKNIVYEGVEGKVILTFKKRYNASDSSVTRLDQDIADEIQKLTNLNHTQLQLIDTEIEELKFKLEQLDKQREQLLSSPYLKKLNALKAQALEVSSELAPGLSVYLKN